MSDHPGRESLNKAAPPTSTSQTDHMEHIHLLGMAGLSRNIGFGANKVFAGPLLQSFHASQPVIGVLLGLEGLLGLLLNPLTGWMSDRTRRYGLRRKIYVLTGLPLAAVMWLLFCSTRHFAFAATALVLFYLFQQAYVSPYQAWMPELTSVSKWGVASGYLNLWWQLGSFISFLAIPLVWKDVSHTGAYGLTAVLMAGGGLVTGLAVPERAPGTAADDAAAAVSGAKGSGWTATLPKPDFRKLLGKNLLLFFIAQACAWLAFEAIASFFTLYMVHHVHGTLLDSALAMSLFTLTGMGGAVLSGRLYRKGSPKVLLAVNLGVFGALAILGLLIHTLLPVFIVVAIEGIFWAGNLTVAYVLATDLLQRATTDDKEADAMRGSLYGLTNVVEAVGLLVAAPLTGLVIHWSNNNYGAMFLVSCVASFVAMVLVLCIRV